MVCPVPRVSLAWKPSEDLAAWPASTGLLNEAQRIHLRLEEALDQGASIKAALEALACGNGGEENSEDEELADLRLFVSDVIAKAAKAPYRRGRLTAKTARGRPACSGRTIAVTSSARTDAKTHNHALSVRLSGGVRDIARQSASPRRSRNMEVDCRTPRTAEFGGFPNFVTERSSLSDGDEFLHSDSENRPLQRHLQLSLQRHLKQRAREQTSQPTSEPHWQASASQSWAEGADALLTQVLRRGETGSRMDADADRQADSQWWESIGPALDGRHRPRHRDGKVAAHNASPHLVEVWDSTGFQDAVALNIPHRDLLDDREPVMEAHRSQAAPNGPGQPRDLALLDQHQSLLHTERSGRARAGGREMHSPAHAEAELPAENCSHRRRDPSIRSGVLAASSKKTESGDGRGSTGVTTLPLQTEAERSMSQPSAVQRLSTDTTCPQNQSLCSPTSEGPVQQELSRARELQGPAETLQTVASLPTCEQTNSPIARRGLRELLDDVRSSSFRPTSALPCKAVAQAENGQGISAQGTGWQESCSTDVFVGQGSSEFLEAPADLARHGLAVSSTASVCNAGAALSSAIPQSDVACPPLQAHAPKAILPSERTHASLGATAEASAGGHAQEESRQDLQDLLKEVRRSSFRPNNASPSSEPLQTESVSEASRQKLEECSSHRAAGDLARDARGTPSGGADHGHKAARPYYSCKASGGGSDRTETIKESAACLAPSLKQAGRGTMVSEAQAAQVLRPPCSLRDVTADVMDSSAPLCTMERHSRVALFGEGVHQPFVRQRPAYDEDFGAELNQGTEASVHRVVQQGGSLQEPGALDGDATTGAASLSATTDVLDAAPGDLPDYVLDPGDSVPHLHFAGGCSSCSSGWPSWADGFEGHAASLAAASESIPSEPIVHRSEMAADAFRDVPATSFHSTSQLLPGPQRQEEQVTDALAQGKAQQGSSSKQVSKASAGAAALAFLDVDPAASAQPQGGAAHAPQHLHGRSGSHATWGGAEASSHVRPEDGAQGAQTSALHTPAYQVSESIRVEARAGPTAQGDVPLHDVASSLGHPKTVSRLGPPPDPPRLKQGTEASVHRVVWQGGSLQEPGALDGDATTGAASLSATTDVLDAAPGDLPDYVLDPGDSVPHLHFAGGCSSCSSGWPSWADGFEGHAASLAAASESIPSEPIVHRSEMAADAFRDVPATSFHSTSQLLPRPQREEEQVTDALAQGKAQQGSSSKQVSKASEGAAALAFLDVDPAASAQPQGGCAYPPQHLYGLSGSYATRGGAEASSHAVPENGVQGAQTSALDTPACQEVSASIRVEARAGPTAQGDVPHDVASSLGHPNAVSRLGPPPDPPRLKQGTEASVHRVVRQGGSLQEPGALDGDATTGAASLSATTDVLDAAPGDLPDYVLDPGDSVPHLHFAGGCSSCSSGWPSWADGFEGHAASLAAASESTPSEPIVHRSEMAADAFRDVPATSFHSTSQLLPGPQREEQKVTDALAQGKTQQGSSSKQVSKASEGAAALAFLDVDPAASGQMRGGAAHAPQHLHGQSGSHATWGGAEASSHVGPEDGVQGAKSALHTPAYQKVSESIRVEARAGPTAQGDVPLHDVASSLGHPNAVSRLGLPPDPPKLKQGTEATSHRVVRQGGSLQEATTDVLDAASGDLPDYVLDPGASVPHLHFAGGCSSCSSGWPSWADGFEGHAASLAAVSESIPSEPIVHRSEMAADAFRDVPATSFHSPSQLLPGPQLQEEKVTDALAQGKAQQGSSSKQVSKASEGAAALAFLDVDPAASAQPQGGCAYPPQHLYGLSGSYATRGGAEASSHVVPEDGVKCAQTSALHTPAYQVSESIRVEARAGPTAQVEFPLHDVASSLGHPNAVSRLAPPPDPPKLKQGTEASVHRVVWQGGSLQEPGALDGDATTGAASLSATTDVLDAAPGDLPDYVLDPGDSVPHLHFAGGCSSCSSGWPSWADGFEGHAASLAAASESTPSEPIVHRSEMAADAFRDVPATSFHSTSQLLPRPQREEEKVTDALAQGKAQQGSSSKQVSKASAGAAALAFLDVDPAASGQLQGGAAHAPQHLHGLSGSYATQGGAEASLHAVPEDGAQGAQTSALHTPAYQVSESIRVEARAGPTAQGAVPLHDVASSLGHPKTVSRLGPLPDPPKPKEGTEASVHRVVRQGGSLQEPGALDGDATTGAASLSATTDVLDAAPGDLPDYVLDPGDSVPHLHFAGGCSSCSSGWPSWADGFEGHAASLAAASESIPSEPIVHRSEMAADAFRDVPATSFHSTSRLLPGPQLEEEQVTDALAEGKAQQRSSSKQVSKVSEGAAALAFLDVDSAALAQPQSGAAHAPQHLYGLSGSYATRGGAEASSHVVPEDGVKCAQTSALHTPAYQVSESIRVEARAGPTAQVEFPLHDVASSLGHPKTVSRLGPLPDPLKLKQGTEASAHRVVRQGGSLQEPGALDGDATTGAASLSATTDVLDAASGDLPDYVLEPGASVPHLHFAGGCSSCSSGWPSWADGFEGHAASLAAASESTPSEPVVHRSEMAADALRDVPATSFHSTSQLLPGPQLQEEQVTDALAQGKAQQRSSSKQVSKASEGAAGLAFLDVDSAASAQPQGGCAHPPQHLYGLSGSHATRGSAEASSHAVPEDGAQGAQTSALHTPAYQVSESIRVEARAGPTAQGDVPLHDVASLLGHPNAVSRLGSPPDPLKLKQGTEASAHRVVRQGGSLQEPGALDGDATTGAASLSATTDVLDAAPGDLPDYVLDPGDSVPHLHFAGGCSSCSSGWPSWADGFEGHAASLAAASESIPSEPIVHRSEMAADAFRDVPATSFHSTSQLLPGPQREEQKVTDALAQGKAQQGSSSKRVSKASAGAAALAFLDVDPAASGQMRGGAAHAPQHLHGLSGSDATWGGAQAASHVVLEDGVQGAQTSALHTPLLRDVASSLGHPKAVSRLGPPPDPLKLKQGTEASAHSGVPQRGTDKLSTSFFPGVQPSHVKGHCPGDASHALTLTSLVAVHANPPTLAQTLAEPASNAGIRIGSMTVSQEHPLKGSGDPQHDCLSRSSPVSNTVCPEQSVRGHGQREYGAPGGPALSAALGLSHFRPCAAPDTGALCSERPAGLSIEGMRQVSEAASLCISFGDAGPEWAELQRDCLDSPCPLRERPDVPLLAGTGPFNVGPEHMLTSTPQPGSLAKTDSLSSVTASEAEMRNETQHSQESVTPTTARSLPISQASWKCHAHTRMGPVGLPEQDTVILRCAC